MSKLVIAITSESAAANTFLAADGMLNFDAVSKLQEKVAAAIKVAAKTTPIKPSAIYVIKRRAKPVKYSAALEKKGDHKYLVNRAVKVMPRKTLRPESLATVSILLQVIDDPKLNASLKSAGAAIARHMKKCETVTAKVTKEKGKLRDVANSTFDKSLALLKSHLATAGLKDVDIVETQGMMGKTVLVRLSKDNIVSIGKSDATRFAAAVKMSKAIAANPAPAKTPAAPAKKVVAAPVKKVVAKPAVKRVVKK